MVAVPRAPELQIAFALMGAGVMFGANSKNVRLKRIVGPVVITLFAYVWLESLRRTLDPPPVVLYVFAVILAINGVKALKLVRYCTRCGATIQDGKRRKTCRACASINAH